jgi:hypothetical protein
MTAMPRGKTPQTTRFPTVNDVVASNLRTLRESRGLSRSGLVKQLNEVAGDDWTQWRIIDLEGARSPNKPPSPITWAEIVSLTFVLDVTVFEIVMPPDDSPGSVQISIRTWDMLPRALVPDTPTHTRAFGIDANLFSMTLFRLPAELVRSEMLEKAGERLNYKRTAAEIARDYAKMTELVDDLAQRVKELDDFMEETDGIDS